MFRPPDRMMTPTPHSCSPPLMASCWNGDRGLRGPFDRAWLACPSGLHQRSSTPLFFAFTSRRWVPPRRPLFCLHLTDRYRNHCRGGGDRSQRLLFLHRIWHGGMECRWLKNGRKGRDAKHLQKAFFPTSSFEASLHMGMSFREVGKPQQRHFPPSVSKRNVVEKWKHRLQFFPDDLLVSVCAPPFLAIGPVGYGRGRILAR